MFFHWTRGIISIFHLESSRWDCFRGGEDFSCDFWNHAESNMCVLQCLILSFPDTSSWLIFSISFLLWLYMSRQCLNSRHRCKGSNDHVGSRSYIKVWWLFIVKSYLEIQPDFPRPDWSISHGLEWFQRYINLQKFQYKHTTIHLFVFFPVGNFRLAFSQFLWSYPSFGYYAAMSTLWRKKNALVLSLTLTVS